MPNYVENTKDFIFLENEYDVIEKKLLSLDSPRDVYKNLANIIAKKFNCKYVLFYSDIDAPDARVLSYGEQAGNSVSISNEIEERKKSSAGRYALLVHVGGGFSVPFMFPDGELGYIFVGANMQGNLYQMSMLKEMLPIVRILNHTLVYMEALRGRLERDQLRYAFSKYVSPDVVDSIVEHPEQIALGGKRACLSVVFTDLQGFTSMSDEMEPEVIVRILNQYFTEMGQVILGLGGTIDKFEGDAIMAFFGAPKTMEDHAIRCCLSALRMRKMEALLNERLLESKLISKPLYTRIGINTGDMIVGNVGAVQHLEYTIIGSNVNIASRIENCNKVYGTQILMSEQTYNLVSDYFECRYVDSAYLKGVKQAIKLYELLSEKPSIKELLEDFGRSRAVYSDDDAVLEEL